VFSKFDVISMMVVVAVVLKMTMTTMMK